MVRTVFVAIDLYDRFRRFRLCFQMAIQLLVAFLPTKLEAVNRFHEIGSGQSLPRNRKRSVASKTMMVTKAASRVRTGCRRQLATLPLIETADETLHYWLKLYKIDAFNP